jgi:hypothetical protein
MSFIFTSGMVTSFNLLYITSLVENTVSLLDFTQLLTPYFVTGGCDERSFPAINVTGLRSQNNLPPGTLHTRKIP